MRDRRAMFLRVAIPLAILAMPSWAGEPPGAESPQALVERMRAAVKGGNTAEFASCIAPAQRRQWAVAMLRKGKMMMDMLDQSAEAAKTGDAAARSAAAERVAGFRARPEPIRVPAELQAFHEAILQKHGLAGRPMDLSSAAGTAALLAGVDEAALIDDLTALIDSLVEPARRKKPEDFPPDVRDFRIKGDKATARAGDVQLDFVRVDGRWYELMPPKDGNGTQ